MPVYSKYEPKTCQRCNREHLCTGTSHCACFAVEIDDRILDDIAFHFDDCLCSDCLLAMKNLPGETILVVDFLLQPEEINIFLPQTAIQPITDDKAPFID